MRATIWKETGQLHEMLKFAEPGELLERAAAAGIDTSLLEEIELTPQEYRARFDSPMTDEEISAREVRGERDRKIAEVRWRIERHQDQVAMGIQPQEPLLPILEYVQALRDVPNQEGFPNSIIWPSIKEGV